MKDALTVKEIRTLEESARRRGFSEALLIENASSNLAATVDTLKLGRKVLVVAGCGNNGADVLACARKLAARNYKVRIFLIHEKEPNVNSAFQIKLLEALCISMRRLGKDNRNNFLAAVRDSDFIIDGILGIGAHGKLSE
ncbi:MAG: hypothetical protein KKF80_00025, partial [Candidatus Omnitrophica bacterium]|nr:hypothetical protein [Candidatus Omnitrophota bacterium]